MRTEARTLGLNTVPVSRYVVFGGLSLATLAWDLYSKWLVFNTLGFPHRQSESWLVWLWGPDVFRLMTSFNHGALWGMGQGLSGLFAGLSVLAAGGVIYWLFIAKGARSWWLTVALAFVLSGTLGNLYDRLGLHGLRDPETGFIEYAVRDFLYFQLINWPIFNFADSYLVTGAIMLMIQSIWMEQQESGTEPSKGKAKPTDGLVVA